MLKFLKSVRKLAKTGPKRHFRNKLMETKVAGNYLLRFIYIYIYIYIQTNLTMFMALNCIFNFRKIAH